MRAVVCLPWLDRALRDATIDSITDARLRTFCEWDNSAGNIGVAPVWQSAARFALECDGFDWLILMSTAIVLGHAGGADFADALERAEPNPHRPEFRRMVSGIGCGWHLHAIPVPMLAEVGVFDAGFVAYYEDSDWIYRHKLAGFGDLWVEGNVQAYVDLRVNRGDAHSINRGLADPDFGWAQGYYVSKWGGLPRRERYRTPYNDPTLDWTYVGGPTPTGGSDVRSCPTCGSTDRAVMLRECQFFYSLDTWHSVEEGKE